MQKTNTAREIGWARERKGQESAELSGCPKKRSVGGVGGKRGWRV